MLEDSRVNALPRKFLINSSIGCILECITRKHCAVYIITFAHCIVPSRGGKGRRSIPPRPGNYNTMVFFFSMWSASFFPLRGLVFPFRGHFLHVCVRVWCVWLCVCVWGWGGVGGGGGMGSSLCGKIFRLVPTCNIFVSPMLWLLE